MEAVMTKLDEINKHVQARKAMKRIELVNINDVIFDEQSGEIYFNSYRLTGDAVNQLFNIVGLKQHLHKKLNENTPEVWDELKKAIKRLYSGQTLIAEINLFNNTITKLIYSNHDVSVFDPGSIISKIKVAVKELDASKKTLELVSWNFDLDKSKLGIDFTIPDNKFEVFKNYEGNTDMWDMGISLDIRNTKIDISEFYYRLICTNGMVRNTAISKATYKNNLAAKLDGRLIKAFNNSYDKSIGYIKEKAQKMSGGNLSLHEYKEIIDQLGTMNADVEGIYSDIFNSKFIPWHRIVEDYQKKDYVLGTKHEGWLKTANSGVNIYKTFNALTDISSHRQTYSMVKEDDREKMQQMANRILFKEEYDMNNIAPAIDLSYDVKVK